ncbi:hypothetical protein K439DRAFT_1611172 [Ramaria rubella]|nr:hypothetical protein K439DRAFT_1611172 [Ramaria rubella]
MSPTLPRSLALLLTVALVVLPTCAVKPIAPPRPANPYLSPSTDSYNPLHHIASNTLAAIAFTLYLSCALIFTAWSWKRGGRYMMALVIGTYTFSVGLGTRFGLHAQPEAKGLY